tara:strand:- start:568 stop:843 length:276 start_codon:yes stop_codon:yes gene_type:complete
VETRQQFISRMIWMVREVDSSKFNSLDSLPMLEFELKMRDAQVLKQIRDLIVDFLDMQSREVGRSDYFKKISKDISLKTETEFNKIIRKLE